MSVGPAQPMQCREGSSGKETCGSRSSAKEVSGQAEGAAESRSIYKGMSLYLLSFKITLSGPSARFPVISHSLSGNSVAYMEGVALALRTYGSRLFKRNANVHQVFAQGSDSASCKQEDGL